MNKIKLKDGKVLLVTDNSTTNELFVVKGDYSTDEIRGFLTEDNLERYELLTEEDVVFGIYTNKKLVSITILEEDNYVINIKLRDIFAIEILEKRVVKIEDEKLELKELVDTLVLESLGV